MNIKTGFAFRKLVDHPGFQDVYALIIQVSLHAENKWWTTCIRTPQDPTYLHLETRILRISINTREIIQCVYRSFNL